MSWRSTVARAVAKKTKQTCHILCTCMKACKGFKKAWKVDPITLPVLCFHFLCGFRLKIERKKKVASTRNSRNVKLYWGSASKNWSSAWLVTIKLLNSLCQTQWITLSQHLPHLPTLSTPPANTWCWVHSMRLWHVEPWPGIVKANGQLLAPANSNWSLRIRWKPLEPTEAETTLLVRSTADIIRLTGAPFQSSWKTILPNSFGQPANPGKALPSHFPQASQDTIRITAHSWKGGLCTTLLEVSAAPGVEVLFWASFGADQVKQIDPKNPHDSGGRGNFSPRHLEMSFPNEKVTTCEWRKSWFWIFVGQKKKKNINRLPHQNIDHGSEM